MTALSKFLKEFDMAYGPDVMMLDKSQIMELIKTDIECLMIDQKQELRQAYESGQNFGHTCSFNAYYQIKYLGDEE